jgi:hypothetical protein
MTVGGRHTTKNRRFCDCRAPVSFARLAGARGTVADETVYTRTTRKALEALGGAYELAAALGRPLDEVNDWLSGRQVPPDKAFLELLEIVSRRR